jgi:hypothetical protein
MTGPEHYRAAERLLAEAGHQSAEGVIWIRPENLAAAQVHATLALAAATAGQTSVLAVHHDINDMDVDAWHEAAGAKPQGGADRG